MWDKLIPLCRLYENTSKTTGKRYFVGNLSFTAKLLLLQNEEAKEGEPQWTLFLTEREPKPQLTDTARGGDGIPDPGEPGYHDGRAWGGGDNELPREWGEGFPGVPPSMPYITCEFASRPFFRNTQFSACRKYEP
jgi:hypothetical protein